MNLARQNLRVVIAGGGPAGSSLAIRMALLGVEVTLVERESFPRQKLCGEFISPECFDHFRELGVLDEMLAAGGDRIGETCFYETGGRSITVPSEWFSGGQPALSLSRAEMDNRLLVRAREVGVDVREETTLSGISHKAAKICGVTVRRSDGVTTEIDASLVVDATGRAKVISKLAARNERNADSRKSQVQRSSMVGFKAHLKNVDLAPGRCEIYSFPGGYGGLSNIENNLANFCFLVRSGVVREHKKADEIINGLVFQNRRAKETLSSAELPDDWHTVAIQGFGVFDPNPFPGIYSVGDAAAFIDPFTGSGMLMAFESAGLLAKAILDDRYSIESAGERYRAEYRKRFSRRLKICRILRYAAFMPRVAGPLIYFLGTSKKMRGALARSTRPREQS